MLVLLLLLTFIFAKAQLPTEYELYLKYLQTKDDLLAYQILRNYPDAVFKDDLMLLLAKEKATRNEKEEAKRLLLGINPKNLIKVDKGEYIKLWKDLELDPKLGFLKDPVLFREFIPLLKLSLEEALETSQELLRRRYYADVINLLESYDVDKVCFTLGKAYLSIRDQKKAMEIFENCNDSRAKGELALIYFGLNQREKAEEIALGIKERNVRSDTFFRMGRLSLIGGNYLDSIGYFFRVDPSYEREFNLGLSYYALKDYSQALEHFLNSLKYSKNGEERSASYFWAYKSSIFFDEEKANEYLIKASNGNGFYHAVASNMLDLSIASKALKVVMEDEGIPKSARIIYAIRSAGFPEYARLEAFKRMGEISPSDIIAISKFDPFLAIRLAVRKYGYGSFVYNVIAFQKPYGESVERAANRYGIDPALIYAVIRQESLFDPYAVSVANAKGLMQLIDSTAKYMARREGIKIVDLFDIDTNILLGTAYLRYLFDQFGNDLVRVLASYNAGPTRVRNWKDVGDIYLFIELIPIQETRNYVKRVLYNYYVYSEILE